MENRLSKEVWDKGIKIIKRVINKNKNKLKGLSFEDLCNECVLKLPHYCSLYDKNYGTSLDTYLYTRFTGFVLDKLRSNIDRESHFYGVECDEDFENVYYVLEGKIYKFDICSNVCNFDPELYLLDKERREFIKNTVLYNLKPKYKMFVEKYFFEDKSIYIIAEELGITPSRVSQMKNSILVVLKSRLKRYM